MEEVNRGVWVRTAPVFARAEGWLDSGEYRAVMAAVTRNGGAEKISILDIGVGGGRTIPLIAPFSSDYVGIDYTPEMVVAARARYVGWDIQLGDVRSLDLEDGRFDFVLFSNNGMDSLPHDDRAKAVAEMVRVCADGGTVAYSTHNRLGPGSTDRPWKPHTIGQAPRESLRRVKKRGLTLVEAMRNYSKLRPLEIEREDWAQYVDMSHDFGTVQHFISPRAALQEAYDAGLKNVHLLNRHGIAFRADSDTSRLWNFHVVGFKPPRPAS